jgi:hypothetical protein
VARLEAPRRRKYLYLQPHESPNIRRSFTGSSKLPDLRSIRSKAEVSVVTKARVGSDSKVIKAKQVYHLRPKIYV